MLMLSVQYHLSFGFQEVSVPLTPGLLVDETSIVFSVTQHLLSEALHGLSLNPDLKIIVFDDCKNDSLLVKEVTFGTFLLEIRRLIEKYYPVKIDWLSYDPDMN